MPGFEVKIWGIKYKESNQSKCTRWICYKDGCRDVEVPCRFQEDELYEVIVHFTYPDVTKEEEMAILFCSDNVVYVISGIIGRTVGSCTAFDELCRNEIQNSIDSINDGVEIMFHECLRKSGLSDDIILECQVHVFVRESVI